MKPNNDDWIEESNKKIIHYLWTIFVSIVTAVVTIKLVMG